MAINKFETFVVEAVLKNIIVREGKNEVVLVFHAPKLKTDYKRIYTITDSSGREGVDFNRAMGALGANKNNYKVWLSRVVKLNILFKIAVNHLGFVQQIKRLEKSKKQEVVKSFYLDTIEGLSEADRNFLMSLDLETLKKELF